jgi:YidC/Oxa1 family membrane protein insertase
MERTQRLIFFALPILFIPFIANFKAGLVLYWATTNLWTVGQGIVTRRLVPRAKKGEPQKKSSRTPPRSQTAAAATEAHVAPEPAMAPQGSSGQPRRVKRKKKRGGRR